MSTAKEESAEARRLEALWGGKFGEAYIKRNSTVSEHRQAFWTRQMEARPISTVLEIGCNTGANLVWLAPSATVYGVDVSLPALAELKGALPSARAVNAAARRLPFPDASFDLAFTMGVLIHQPPNMLPIVMTEIVRCSRKYVLCGEYFAEEPTEVLYRGHTGALFKRNFGGLYQKLFPELALLESGFLAKADGWDDVTYWVFKK